MLQAPDGMNAEGYCKTCNAPLDIGGICYHCELQDRLKHIELEKRITEYMRAYYANGATIPHAPRAASEDAV